VKGLLPLDKTSGPSDFDKAVRFGIIFLVIYALYKWLFCSKKDTNSTDDKIPKLESEIQRLRHEFINKWGFDPETDPHTLPEDFRRDFFRKWGFDPTEAEDV
jgi:hypothetical protein